jgi:hypothetical protein
MAECPLLAQSGQLDRARVCLLLDNSGQSWVSAGNGLSANDPKRTWQLDCGRLGGLRGLYQYRLPPRRLPFCCLAAIRLYLPGWQVRGRRLDAPQIFGCRLAHAQPASR